MNNWLQQFIQRFIGHDKPQQERNIIASEVNHHDTHKDLESEPFQKQPLTEQSQNQFSTSQAEVGTTPKGSVVQSMQSSASSQASTNARVSASSDFSKKRQSNADSLNQYNQGIAARKQNSQANSASSSDSMRFAKPAKMPQRNPVSIRKPQSKPTKPKLKSPATNPNSLLAHDLKLKIAEQKAKDRIKEKKKAKSTKSHHPSNEAEYE